MYYSRDHLGSLRELVQRPFAGSTSLQARYDYDLFGRKTTILSTFSPETDPSYSFAGLYQNGSYDLAVYRIYDPDLGRWISRDPIGEAGGLNLFSYAANDPVNIVDWSGLCPDERGFVGRDGQFRDPNTGFLRDANGIPLKDQVNPFNPENFGDSTGIAFPRSIPPNLAPRVSWRNGWRTPDGKFASPRDGGRGGASAEQAVWDAVRQKPGWNLVEGRVSVRNESGQLRVYDGVAISPRGRVIGLEVKSGSATRTQAQSIFDRGVTSFTPVMGVGRSSTLPGPVTRSMLIRVP
jgi:RHS repeat-associated protein